MTSTTLHPEPIREVPLCLGCLEPVSPFAHVCPACGHSVGQFTPYMPLEGIRFFAECVGGVWDRMWFDDSRSLGHRLWCAVVIASAAPWLFLAIPLVLWRWHKERKTAAA